MIKAKVTLNDGNSFITRYNGTEQELKDYYAGHILNMGTVSDDPQRVVRVEILERSDAN